MLSNADVLAMIVALTTTEYAIADFGIGSFLRGAYRGSVLERDSAHSALTK